MLRDSAMVEKQDEEQFQDYTRHTTFHANSLWVDLHALDALLTQSRERGEAGIGLPVIVNRKTVDPSDSSSTEVIQIETAMGGAVDGSTGPERSTSPRTQVPSGQDDQRAAARPVRHLRLDDQSNIVSVIAHADPFVDLDKPYKLVPGFEQRFAKGAPSLRQATSSCASRAT